MKQLMLSFLIFLATLSAYCQTGERESSLNFGFEKNEKGRPVGWNDFGSPSYTISLDSTNVKSGKYSASIQSSEGSTEYKAWSFTIPDNYDGKRITLTGYIKTENVLDGYAGLWMTIDPSIPFANMDKNGIRGTTDWQKYAITLEMKPEKTKQIVIGGILVGKGKMWLDDLNVTIDGKDIKDAKPYVRKVLPAELDKEFDKGSRIARFALDKKTVENLNVLGLVWGYLKYYHPSVAKGDYNWDYELFRVLPKISASKNRSERDAVLTKWINRLGPFEEAQETQINPADIKMKPDLDWITKSDFSSELTALLLKVKNAKRTENHFYIDLIPGVKNPEFKNETPDSSMKYPDTGYRLLALYRYWNIIQYYFPYKNLIEEDWKVVLKEFVPKFINAANETEYTLTVLEMIARVHDTHAYIRGENQALKNHLGLYSAAVRLSFVENKAVVTGFYNDTLGKETDLKVGDVVAKINNQPIETIVKDHLKRTPASNYPTQLREIAPNLLRTNDTIIKIEFIGEGKESNKTIKTYPLKQFNINSRFWVSDTCFKRIGDDIAYINNGSLKNAYLPELWKEIQNTKGLIIDIRNYPSDFPIVYELSNYLMPRSTPFVKLTNGSIIAPGLFTYKNTLNAGKDNDSPYKGKVVILVNEISQSAAEFHAMAYRVFSNAVVIGSTTAGADGNISFFYLPGGIRTTISGIGVYYPDGRETQRIGIVPDIEVKPTVEGIKNRRDELLEKAIKIINAQ